MRPGKPLHALPVLFVVLLVLPVAGLASPQPTPVCGFCGEQFAAESGVNVTVAESSVVVQVHENGSATWTVRNRLSNGSGTFREHPGLLNATASGLASRHHGLPEGPDVTFVSARMDGETAVLVYRDSDAATRHAGLLVVDYLHEGGYEPWYHVNAERFTVSGPEGTVVTNTPDSGTVEGRNVTWSGTSGGEYGFGEDLEGSPYVVFGPDGSAGVELQTAASLGLATLPIVVGALQNYVLFQTLVFAAVLGIVSLALRRWSPEPSPERVGAVLAGLGVLGIVGPVVGQGFRLDPVSGPPVFALALGSLAWDDRLRERVRTARSQVRLAAGLLAGAFVVLIPVYAFGASYERPVIVAARSTAIAVPLAAMLPLGAALDDGRRAVGWWLLAVLGFVLLAVSMVNPVEPPTGLGGGLAAFFLFGLALVGPVVGAPVVMLGRRFAGTGTERDGDGRGTLARGTTSPVE